MNWFLDSSKSLSSWKWGGISNILNLFAGLRLFVVFDRQWQRRWLRLNPNIFTLQGHKMLPSFQVFDFWDERGSLPVLVVVKDSPNIILNLTYQSLTRSSPDSDFSLSPKSLLRETNTFQSHMTVKHIKKDLTLTYATKCLNLEAGLSYLTFSKEHDSKTCVSILPLLIFAPGFIFICLPGYDGVQIPMCSSWQ